MPYYLKFHFAPRLNQETLAPLEMENGGVDHRALGLVQNVVMNQILAELVDSPPEEGGEYGPGIPLAEKKFPAGRNCIVDPANPNHLLAATNGRVVWSKDCIQVFKNLTLPEHVDMGTGDISFLGDLTIHGGVRTGFKVEARNILVKRTVGGANLSASGSIVVESGLKGGKAAVVKAGKNIRLNFCENAEILAGETVLVNGSCMHSNLYVGGRLVVKGRLQGGFVHSTSLVYVGERLGGGIGTPTRVSLGYDPFLVRRARQIEQNIETLGAELATCRERNEEEEQAPPELQKSLVRTEKKRSFLIKKLDAIREQLERDASFERCALSVPGEVRPGVEVCIGPAKLMINDFLTDVRFQYKEGEIHISSPAMKQK
jgi:uncharacterized protein